MQKTDYRNTFAISQSAIKCFRSRTLSEFKRYYIDQEQQKSDEKFKFGSFTDTLMYTPELISERFFLPARKVQEPSPAVKEVMYDAYKKVSGAVEIAKKLNESGKLPAPLPVADLRNIRNFDAAVLTAARALNFGGSTYSDERIIKSIVPYNEYWNFIHECEEKQIILPHEHVDALDIQKVLTSHTITKEYFVPSENNILLFQQEIYEDFQLPDGGVLPLKGAIDTVRIDLLRETVQEVDLKAFSDVERFEPSIRKFGYLLQRSFYNHLLRNFLKTYKDGIYAHFVVLPPINVVIDRYTKIPYIYEYTFRDLEVEEFGDAKFKITGWISTLEEIYWHIKNDQWSLPKELSETGKIKISFYE